MIFIYIRGFVNELIFNVYVLLLFLYLIFLKILVLILVINGVDVNLEEVRL